MGMGPGGLDEPLAARRLRDRELAVLDPALSDSEHDRRDGALLLVPAALRRHGARDPLGHHLPQRTPRAVRANPESRRDRETSRTGSSASRRFASKPEAAQAPEATISVLHETVFEEMRRRIFEGRTRAGQADVEQVERAGACRRCRRITARCCTCRFGNCSSTVCSTTAVPFSWRRRSACCGRPD